jgi:pantoate--beta-alanine ligase
MIATGRITEVRKILDVERSDGKRIGFVPTMGALHEGHRSLIRRARTENDFVVVSIYVNPTQFNQSADLDAYPRTFAADLESCAAEGAGLVFHPDDDEIYPRPPLTRVDVGVVTESMEGAARPGHFAGVALVCTKLFNIVGPCRAYFGEKDAQQLRVIRRMVADLDLPVEIVGCPTIRDEDGLALSSRNARLRPDDRLRVLALSRALRQIRELVASGERDVSALKSAGRAVLEAAPVDGIDYLEVVDAETLQELERVDGVALVCGAVRIGDVRLIDNMLVGTPEEE